MASKTGNLLQQWLRQANNPSMAGPAYAAFLRDNANDGELIAQHAFFVAQAVAENNKLHLEPVASWLKNKRETNDGAADDERALQRMLDAIERHAPKLVDAAWTQDRPDAQDHVGTAEHNGMLRPDALAADYLGRIGDMGKALAERLRDKSRERWLTRIDGIPVDLWLLWVDTDAPWAPAWLRALLETLWVDVVGPRLERERRNTTALSLPVHRDVTQLCSTVRPRYENGQRTLPLHDGTKIELADPRKTDLPAIEHDVLESLIERGLSKFGSVTSHRLLRWEVRTATEQWLEGQQQFDKIHVDGGWQVLAAEHLGLTSKKAGSEVHAIVAAQAHCMLVLPNGSYGNLLSYWVQAPRGQRRGHIRLTLGDMICPNFVHTLPRGDWRRLVPVTELPPLVGRTNEHGPQATLSLAVVRHMREHARELAQDGAVRIPLAQWSTMAISSGLQPHIVVPVIDRWVQDGDDAPAFLTRVDKDAYTLGDAHAPARNFLLDAGERELTASKSGQVSAKRRQQRRKRNALRRK